MTDAKPEPRAMDAQGRKEWRPMHTAHGLTVWTQGRPDHRFAIVRRDSDGLRVSSAKVFHPIKPHRMMMLYQEFSGLVGPALGRFVNTYDVAKATPDDRAQLRQYIAQLDALLARHIAVRDKPT